MVLACRRIQQFSADSDETAFFANELVQSAIAYQLQIIGEAASKVSEAFKGTHDVDWPAIVGLRNRIVHGYRDLDLKILWSIVRNEVDPLRTTLEQWITPAR
ncbi:MAG TPA: HepT-like ribonuclease domain-containing protein [Dehalococcoidia bacterium]|jgi:uncharacterized protein with HEPN domain